MQHNIAFSFADGRTVFFQAHNNELLLDAALRNGICLPVDCREGVCGTCRGLCEKGRYEQDYVDEDILSESELSSGAVLSCQTRVQSDGTFYYDFDSGLCAQNAGSVISAEVTSVTQVSDAAAILELTSAEVVKFLPGQYARIQVPAMDNSAGGEWRSYSFATQPDAEGRMKFLIRLLPDGVMSNYLRDRCQPGDTLKLEAPLGTFYHRESVRPQWFIAGGTGLSAFLGMLDELSGQPTTKLTSVPVTLFYGVNQVADLCEVERLDAFKQSMPEFDWHPVVTQADEQWSGKTGFIPQHLNASDMSDGADIYLCGPPPMVDAVNQWVADQSLADIRIFSEKFVST